MKKIDACIKSLFCSFVPKTRYVVRDTPYAQRRTRYERGAALIIVIFAMMLFAMLGWTLANLQTSDFEANLRNFDSEQALSLAEAGSQWALNQLYQDTCGRISSGSWGAYCGSVDSDCNDSGDWLASPHILSPGQYNLCVRDPDPATESGDAVIEARGYVPAQNNYRAMREIKLQVQLGGLTSAIMTQPQSITDSQKGLFDWHLAGQSHTVQVEGNIYVGHYRGDSDTNDDEIGQDYDPAPAPLLPQDIAAPNTDARGFSSSYPSIDMQWFYNNANTRWPTSSARDIAASGSEVVVEMSGSRIRVNGSNFFNSADVQNVIIIRDGVSNWWQGSPGTNWTVITGVTNVGAISRANVSPSVSWPNGQAIKLGRRIYQNINGGGGGDVWYVGEQGGGGLSSADTLIDLRSGNVRLSNIYLICEGDIVIIGDNRLLIRFIGSINSPRYPSLATKNGNVISTDMPSGSNDGQRMDKRQIAGLIYSETGLVSLNYLGLPGVGSSNFRGNSVYGNRIALDGQINIRYLANAMSSSEGFDFTVATLNWNEQ